MAKVTLENVSKRFGTVEAVKSFDLKIQDQEFLVLLGPSGCGKSTTLRMIAGLEEVTEGNIYIGDRLVNDMPPRERDIAMVFQDYALYPHMTVRQNMGFSLKLAKVDKKAINQQVDRSADILGITELLNRKPRELSGGQRQRVAVGRAIVRQPAVFLFDEPLSNLDAKLRGQMRAELSRLHQRLETTMIYVTHDQVEAMTMGTMIVIMKDGLVQQVAPPMEIYERPINRFVAGFIGNPGMNFLPAKVVCQGGDVFVQSEGFRLTVPRGKSRQCRLWEGKEIILGLRPEHLEDKAHASPDDFQGSFTADIEVVETLGSEIQLNAKVGGVDLVARVDPRCRARVDQPIELAVNLDKMHLFSLEGQQKRIEMD